MSKEVSIVLWNVRETKEKVAQFVLDYAKMRQDLCDHYEHKGHVALRYSDDWAGFMAYCKEKLNLDSTEQTVRLQISTAQVSREVGVEVPMNISRQLAKLPPAKQKEVYEEVVGARVQAGQRSANEMEPDVRRVVRREMGVVEKPPVSRTDTAEEVSEALVNSLGPEATVYVIEETAQEPRTADLEPQTVNHPTEVSIDYEAAYTYARSALCTFVQAYDSQDKEAMLALYMDVRQFLANN